MRNRKFLCLALACLATLLWVVEARGELPGSWRKEGVPDFSQHAKTEWGSSWCAPTAAANSIWYFAQHGYPLLGQGLTWGTDEAANKVASDLGADMHTSPTSGTSDPNIPEGWKAYCDRYYPSTAMPHFYTRLVYASKIGGGAALWEFMKRELYRCEDVLPLVSWGTGGGHAITMVGWGTGGILINDPATGGSQHNWGGEYLPVGIDAFLPNGIDLAAWSSGSGIIDAVVVCSPVPEPSALVLVSGGLVFLFACRYRRGAKS